jgi:hypothetical protein
MSLLLLTLASDPYDRPGHWMPWRRRCGRQRIFNRAGPPDTVVVLDVAFTVPGASPRIPALRCRQCVQKLLASPGDVEDDD